MKLIEVNWNPTSRQLRQFGAICVVALPLLGWLWAGGNLTVVAWLAGIGVALALLGLAYPKGLKPIFLALTIVALPIGLVVGELAMLAIFLFVFAPIGLIFRIMNRDGLQLGIDPSRNTYWQEKKQATGVASYYRQS